MMTARAGLLAGIVAAGCLLAAAPAQAHLPDETSAELRLREGTVEVAISVSALRWLGAPKSGSGEQDGAVAAGLRIAAALSDVDAVALACGGAPVPLMLLGKLDGDALIAAAGGVDRHLVIQLRGDRPADAALAQGCRLFLPTAFGPYYAAMSAPQPVFAAAGGWSELKVTGFEPVPAEVAAAPSERPTLGFVLLVLGTALLAARAGFVWARRERQ
ncbi:MAG: hypothetical protein HQ461_15990 [Deltaproteobacteria bacterium]|nr:hypothetical protein [Deltaproteobacteria bacterium]